jgi:hypothetical protein
LPSLTAIGLIFVFLFHFVLIRRSEASKAQVSFAEAKQARRKSFPAQRSKQLRRKSFPVICDAKQARRKSFSAKRSKTRIISGSLRQG